MWSYRRSSTEPLGKTLLVASRVVTCDTRGLDPLGVVAPGAVLLDGERIAEVGPAEALLARHRDVARFEHAGLVTPGLVDAHTHAAWVGTRAEEYAMRMAGADYEAIAAKGGGIVASMRAVRAASGDELAKALHARVVRMLDMGVTTLEVKSGYGLSEVDERKQLEAIRTISGDGVPTLVPTFLGLHALPPEARTGARDDRAHYAERATGWLDGLARDGLARYVDAYLDRAAFSVGEARPFLERARELGLGVRLHVGQFADVGGAELAASLGAASVDHLEHLSRSGADALAAAGTSAVLLPVASYTLGQASPDVAALRAAGVPLVVASDANPGTAPTESLPLAMAFAARSYGLTVDEVVLGVTARAAASLGVDAGRLAPGSPADLVLWDLGHEAELLQPWGTSKVRHVVLRGDGPF
ncbi:MAG: imidazolonepropionase [Deltaproteobacteria bacterium]|nr:imidazolonepropionase [Deltaproteobacteria bacterium]